MLNLKEELHNYNINTEHDINLLRKKIMDSSIQEKIKNHCFKFNRNYNEIYNKILIDDLFADLFVVDIIKQNFYELKTLDYLKQKNYKIVKMAGNGKGSLYLCNGNILTKKTNNSTKSFDFKLTNDNSLTYITHKYINESGGSQDNQFNDIKLFLMEANKFAISSNNQLFPSKINFMAIVDGDYFTKNKLNILKSYNFKNQIKVNHINDM